jgi:hypothetical protein
VNLHLSNRLDRYHRYCHLMMEMILQWLDQMILPKIYKSYRKDIHIEPAKKRNGIKNV